MDSRDIIWDPDNFKLTDRAAKDVPTAKNLLEAIAFANRVEEKEDMAYYLMAVGPKWKDPELKTVKIPDQFSWEALRNNIVKDNTDLRGNVKLLTYDKGLTDISNVEGIIPPDVFNIIAITEKGERESD
eukprot:GHVU01011687.1.p1 GENE.GHVU01011687.1~~GHVU01011687.1.p1  ORF type:complete len:129 (+),score=26.89 GHVU01011687.1:128-514(+)